MSDIGRFLIEKQNDGSHKISYLEQGLRRFLIVYNLEEIFQTMITSNHNFVQFYLACLNQDAEAAYQHPQAHQIIEQIELISGSGYTFYLKQILSAYNKVMRTELLPQNIIPLLPDQENYQ